MSQFIRKIIYFLFSFVLVGIIFFVGYVFAFHLSSKDAPALNFSNSYSFNEKIQFLQTKRGAINTIGLGSSMTLNNLNSHDIMETYPHYANVASWGMTYKDDYEFLQVLNKVYPIQTVILASSISDFNQMAKTVNYNFTEDYLRKDKKAYIKEALSTIDLNYYVSNFLEAKRDRGCSKCFTSLIYDSTGAVNLEKEGFETDKVRWVKDDIEEISDDKVISYLDSLVDYCSNNKIQLVFFQSPLREGLFSKLDTTKRKLLAAQIERVQSLFAGSSAIYINTTDRPWPDSLYVDAIHLNKDGAHAFTRYSMDKLRSVLKSREPQ